MLDRDEVDTALVVRVAQHDAMCAGRTGVGHHVRQGSERIVQQHYLRDRFKLLPRVLPFIGNFIRRTSIVGTTCTWVTRSRSTI